MRSRTLLAATLVLITAIPARGEFLLAEVHVVADNMGWDGEGSEWWKVWAFAGHEADSIHGWSFDESDIGIEMRIDESNGLHTFPSLLAWMSDPWPGDSEGLYIQSDPPRSSIGEAVGIPMDTLFSDRTFSRTNVSLVVDSHIDVPGPALKGSPYTFTAVSLEVHDLWATEVSREQIDTGEWDIQYLYGIDYTYRIHGVPEPSSLIHLAALLLAMCPLRFRR